jgi:CTP synthase
MQVAVIEFARNVANLAGANSTELSKSPAHPVIGLITEWRTETGEVQRRDASSDLGGTMRLGAQECRLVEGSKARELYGQDVIVERHRHRYEVNNNYLPQLEGGPVYFRAQHGWQPGRNGRNCRPSMVCGLPVPS